MEDLNIGHVIINQSLIFASEEINVP